MSTVVAGANLSAFTTLDGNAHLHRLNSLREFSFLYLALRRSFRKDVRKDFFFPHPDEKVRR